MLSNVTSYFHSAVINCVAVKYFFLNRLPEISLNNNT